jgi:hypothetical protein
MIEDDCLNFHMSIRAKYLCLGIIIGRLRLGPMHDSGGSTVLRSTHISGARGTVTKEYTKNHVAVIIIEHD